MSKTERSKRCQFGPWFVHVGIAMGIGLFLACNARVEGCLDIEASNFDLTLDKHDPLSCVYPDLLLKVQYSWDTLSFTTDVLYTNDLGQQNE